MIRPFYLLFVLLVSSIAVAASQTDQTATESDSHHHPSLQEILNNIDESKIHHALHLLSDKFRHGVFPTDTNAVEALHKEDASLAARLMKIAKRQQPADNSTSSAIPSPSQSESTPLPTSQMPSTTKSETPPESTTASSPSTTTAEPTTPSSTTESSSPPPTTTTPSTTAPSTTSEKSTETTTSSSSSSSTTESPSPTTFSTSSTKQETTPSPTTSKKPSTNSEPYTSTYESTTTLPNGDLKTVTAVTVIYPTPTGTTTAAPGLQTGAAAATAGLTKEVFAIVGGAVAVAMAL